MAQQEAERLGVAFNLAQIDSQVPFDGLHPFALDYMRAVYRVGDEKAAAHTLWQKGLSPFTGSATTIAASSKH